ncbi:hypothetical protein [Streptosporangium sp. 'caverna']|uniref:hypothetical protein n=1 Tax=Streptosporangium sp. 'caverna' TaxID=2202249 RepID=UPI000D7EA2DD|nr:hypothetical protein [Streptosporangium sp. 'caverna']AWS43752.1 hypothetical protein DKM19_22770 [Streptosporangium sp. 'caverna']
MDFERGAVATLVQRATRGRVGVGALVVVHGAHRMQWLGEVAALKESLRPISEKKEQADRLRRQAEHGEGGTGALS